MIQGLSGVGLAKIKLEMEFLFEEIGAALSVADVFGDVSAGGDFDGNRITLERCSELLDALAMRVIESLSNAKDRGEAAGDALARQSAPAAVRSAVDDFIERYVSRDRCPADDQLSPAES